MQYWPRKRAASEIARVRFWGTAKDTKMLGFSGYKVGMAHAMITDTRSTSMTKGQQISWPVTIVECPPLTVFSLKFIKGSRSVSQIFADKLDKHLARSLIIPKTKKSISQITPEMFDDVRLVVHTNPSMTTIGKKRPELFEMALSGSKDEKFAKAQELLGKNLAVMDIFKNGQFTDTHAITKGKGYQGPVKRFGVQIRRHKSEKTKRGPGSLGAWCGQQHMMYRVAHAGQMGYHQRTEYNKQILKVMDKPEIVNKQGGFHRYGVIRNPVVIFKGSVTGPIKRLIRFNIATRAHKYHKEMDYELKVIQ